VRLDVRKPDIAISHEVVEVRHELALGQDGQLRERTVLEPGVEAAVERRAGHGVGAQLPQRIPLVDVQAIGRPVLSGSQLPSKDQVARNEA
jgi:hypothetical protein